MRAEKSNIAIMKIFKIACVAAIAASFTPISRAQDSASAGVSGGAEAAPASPSKYPKDDYRNYFGAGWQADAKEVISFAKRMGFSHVMSMGPAMARSPDADGMFFYIETPEYGTYRRYVDPSKKYSPEQIREWETTCALKDASKPFPENLATGWFSTPTVFSVQLDFQQRKVIDRTIDKIIENVKKLQKINPKFKFAGFSWDVPQPFGDFWDAEQATQKGRQITLAHWTGKDSGSKHPDVVHDYATYSEGYFEFLRLLRERAAKELNPDVKFIVEPYNVYNDWMRHMDSDFMKSKGADAKKYMPDFVLEENGTTGFVDDERAFKSGLLDKSRTGTSTPNVWDEPRSRKIAAAAAVNGSWSTWFGRIGGTGNCPRYHYIRDVPARLKIAKLLPVWENLIGTPLSERKWDGSVYSSPSAGMTDSAIWATHPESGEVYFSFVKLGGSVPVPKGYEVEEISALDGVFNRIDGMPPNEVPKWGSTRPPLVKIENGKIIPDDPGVINQPYVVKFKKTEG